MNRRRDEAAAPSESAQIIQSDGDLELPQGADAARGPGPPRDSGTLRDLGTVERELARHAAEPESPTAPELGASHPPRPPGPTRVPRRSQAEAELVRVHRLEQSALLRKAIDLAGAARFANWAFSAPTHAPIGLGAWRKLCDEELLFARLDGADVPDEFHRLRVLDPMDWGSLADLARLALELERSPRNRLLLGRALVLDGDFAGACEFLGAVLERPATPLQRARLLTTLGCALEGLGDPAAALREHERAVALRADLRSVLACLVLGFTLGDRPRALYAIELLERHEVRARGAARRLQRAIRRARMRFELAHGRAPAPVPELKSLALECVCDGVPAVAEVTYQLFA